MKSERVCTHLIAFNKYCTYNYLYTIVQYFVIPYISYGSDEDFAYKQNPCQVQKYFSMIHITMNYFILYMLRFSRS